MHMTMEFSRKVLRRSDMKSKNNTSTVNLLLLVSVVMITIIPLAMLKDAEFEGADGLAEEAISESGYEPWFSPLWEPPSGEIESLLFGIQSALGAGFIGYYFGQAKAGRNATR